MAKMFRDIINPDLVNALDTAIDAQMEILQCQDKLIREILKDHLLDIDSRSYFEWYLSCLSQIRTTLEKEWVLAKELDRRYKVIPPLERKRKKKKRKGGGE